MALRQENTSLSDLCLYSLYGYLEINSGEQSLTINDVPIINMLDKLVDALLVLLLSGDNVEIEQPFRSAITTIELQERMALISHQEGLLQDQKLTLPPIDLIELSRSVANAATVVSAFLADKWPGLNELPRSFGTLRAVNAYRAAGSPFQIL